MAGFVTVGCIVAFIILLFTFPMFTLTLIGVMVVIFIILAVIGSEEEKKVNEQKRIVKEKDREIKALKSNLSILKDNINNVVVDKINNKINYFNKTINDRDERINRQRLYLEELEKEIRQLNERIENQIRYINEIEKAKNSYVAPDIDDIDAKMSQEETNIDNDPIDEDELTQKTEQDIRDEEFRQENKKNYERFVKENTLGVEKVGDLNDYEYSSDGKRMCFINYITGNVVYSGEALFRTLKIRMLNDSDTDKYDA